MPLGGNLRAVTARLRAFGSMRICIVAAIVTLVFGLLAAAFVPIPRLERIGAIDTGSAFDIAIFRCAAQIVGSGDPYRIEPLGTCERKVPRIFDKTMAPAPQPPFVLDVFKPFSNVPDVRFAVGWLAVNIALALFAAGLLSGVSRFPTIAILLGLVWGPGYDTLSLGQLVMVLVVGVAWAAYALQRNQPRYAACVLSLAMMEPHVGLPAFVALFVLEPRARLTILGLVCVGLAWTLALCGPQISWEYVSRVVPLHALAEATNPQQYSLTLAAFALGASDQVAVRLGEAQYALFIVVSILAGRYLRARFSEPAFVVAVPVALSVIGGPFMHFTETLALWPAALLLARYSSGRQRIVAFVLIAMLAVPWRTGAWLKLEAVFALSEATMVWLLLDGFARTRRLVVWASIVVPIVAAHGLISLTRYAPFRALPPATSIAREAPWGSALSPMPWGTFIRTHWTSVSIHELCAKLGTALTFALLLGLIATLADPSLGGRLRTIFKKGSVALRA